MDDTEALFLAMIVCKKGFDTANAMTAWAHKVLLDERAATELRWQWKPQTLGEEGWEERNKVSTLFDPIQSALNAEYSAVHHELDNIGLAMQAWDGAGRFDNLRDMHLCTYLKTPPPGMRVNKKTKPIPRWRSWCVMKIARHLFNQNGVELRKVLKLDVEVDVVSTSWERIAQAESAARRMQEEFGAALEQANDQICSIKKAMSTAKDAHRKSAGRLKLKNQAVTAARRDEREKCREKLRSAREEQKAATRARVEALREKAAAELEAKKLRVEEQYQSAFEKQRVHLNRARARAREAEATQNKANRKIARLEKQLEEQSDSSDA